MRQSEFVTVTLSGQSFGIPIAAVHDILDDHKTTPVALASSDIAGVMNIRGRIVTAIDARRRMGGAPESGKATMNVVVQHKGEPYALVVDAVGEVRACEDASFETNPPNMDPRLAELCKGVYRLEGGLMPVIDVDRLVGGVVGGAGAVGS
jgi:purine-binding chemotaxis protein CheW